MPEIVDELKYDWYAVLGCNIESTKSSIEKAARKLFLKYHPDKTSDSEAPELFLRVQKAKEILLDDAKRKLIDDAKKVVIKRQEYDDHRSKNMDVRRKRMRDDLEQKLQESKKPTGQSQSKAEKSNLDFERLRKEGAALREASAREEELKEAKRAHDSIRQKKAQEKKNTAEGGACQIKIKWKRSRQSHSDESLVQLFKVFGTIEVVLMVGDKGNGATILFTEEIAARNAVIAYDASTEYRVTIPADELHDDNKRAAIFTHVYASSGDTSRGAEVFSTDSGESNQESDLIRQMRRAVEREELIRSLESVDASSAWRGASSSVKEETKLKMDSNPIDSNHNHNSSHLHNASSQSPFLTVPSFAIKEADVLRRMVEASRLKKLKVFAKPTVVNEDFAKPTLINEDSDSDMEIC
jgi:curved DNA-binding protein CbpA